MSEAGREYDKVKEGLAEELGAPLAARPTGFCLGLGGSERLWAEQRFN